MKLAVGCIEPFVAITETVDVTPGIVSLSTPQPVHRPSPIATPASMSICMPRRLFQPKQQSTTARAEPGIDGLELWPRAAVAVEVVTVSVAEATLPDGVTGVGENPHDAPEGNPEQLNEMAEANPFCGATKTVIVPLCPGATVRDAGERATEKLGVDRLTL